MPNIRDILSSRKHLSGLAQRVLSQNIDETSEAPTSDTKENTWVYVWNLTSDKVGHTAIQVGGDAPKLEGGDDAVEYLSIHPSSIPAIGPTVVLPLPAGLSASLMEDMRSEAAAQNSALDEIDRNPILDKKELTSLSPDHTFKLSNLDTQAMRAQIKKIRDGVETGETAYQLVPAINAAKFVREIPAYLTYDPVDIASLERAKKSVSDDQAVYNCSTLVDSVLDTGGMPSKKPSFWSEGPTTPNTITERVLESVSSKSI